jgi:two-component sensor histidine kinase
MYTMKSLVFLQKQILKDPVAVAAFEDTLGRMDSMMILYDQLYLGADYNRSSVRNYLSTLIDQILGYFPGSDTVKVKKDIEEFELDAQKSQSLGIIINELLTNIMKYAFANGENRWISVVGRLEGKTVTVSVEDNGSGMPESIDFEHSPGFGLMLVKELTRQLDGGIRIERGEGTRVVLEFES